MAALVLLAIPWLAVQFISTMEMSLRGSQEQAIGATARAVTAALSDRPALFRATAGGSDPEGEERRRIVALFAPADPAAPPNPRPPYSPSQDPHRLPSTHRPQ